MPKVLHIGPCDSPGGMANVMRILAEHPPEGWDAELLSSHVEGSPWAKWRAYRRARATLAQMLRDEARRPDIVHLHTAADWSWWRKRRFARMANKAGVPNIVHIHSGQFDTWLGVPESRRCINFRNDAESLNMKFVALSLDWKEQLEPLLGDVHFINNPLHPKYRTSKLKRKSNQLLVLGRNDPVKRHNLAQEVCIALKKELPDLELAMTGVSESTHPWMSALGWVSEDRKMELLWTSSALLVPSKFEGQPMVVIEALACGLPVIVSEHLSSLPSQVMRAGPSVQDWCEQVRNVLNSPSAIDFDSTDYDTSTVSSKWGECYSSIRAD